mmetsp:Transcript_34230/g.72070  ORF Transcript_34230/g.72070 Transcript_34230/m.72070 type:complete len:102 (-) Transcript_34230:866-1171(-)
MCESQGNIQTKSKTTQRNKKSEHYEKSNLTITWQAEHPTLQLAVLQLSLEVLRLEDLKRRLKLQILRLRLPKPKAKIRSSLMFVNTMEMVLWRSVHLHFGT